MPEGIRIDSRKLIFREISLVLKARIASARLNTVKVIIFSDPFIKIVTFLAEKNADTASALALGVGKMSAAGNPVVEASAGVRGSVATDI